MKDKEVMDFIQSLGRSIKALEEKLLLRIETLESQQTEALTGVVVKYCPVCKHPTLQQEGNRGFPWGGSMTMIRKGEVRYDWLCLNCGVKLVCETKTECKVLKEEKK